MESPRPIKGKAQGGLGEALRRMSDHNAGHGPGADAPSQVGCAGIVEARRHLIKH